MSLATPEQASVDASDVRKQQLDIVRVIETAAATRVAGVQEVAAPLLNIITDLDTSNNNTNTNSRVSKREHQRPGSNVTDTGTATSKTSGMGPGTSSEVSCDAPTHIQHTLLPSAKLRLSCSS